MATLGSLTAIVDSENPPRVAEDGSWSDDAELDFRAGTSVAMDHLRRIPTFAGTYIDREGADRWVVLISKDDDLNEDQLLGLITSEEIRSRTTIRVVAHSLNELRERKRHVETMMSVSKEVLGVGLDIRKNGLYVVLAPGVRAPFLVDTLPPSSVPLYIVNGINSEDSCNDRLNCGGADARRGGVSLNRGGGVCTSGLNVWKNGVAYSTTAGHCWYGSNSGLVASGTQTFGSLNGSNWLFSGSHCDCRLVTTSGTTPNRLYRNNADKYQPVTSKTAYSQVGDYVRLYGRNTQSTGQVTYLEYTYISPTCGCQLSQATLASYSSAPGDSGAAIASTGGSIAKGIHSGRSGDEARFFEIWVVESQMGVTIRTS